MHSRSFESITNIPQHMPPVEDIKAAGKAPGFGSRPQTASHRLRQKVVEKSWLLGSAGAIPTHSAGGAETSRVHRGPMHRRRSSSQRSLSLVLLRLRTQGFADVLQHLRRRLASAVLTEVVLRHAHVVRGE